MSAIHKGAPALGPRHQMITSIDISNFRSFERLKIDKCSRLNVIVGENGVGKTALLEAIFLALGQSPEVSTRYRALRGMDVNMSGSFETLERALWRDLFFQGDMSKAILVSLTGSGKEQRSVRVAKHTPRTKLVAVRDSNHLAGVQVDDSPSGGLRFVWTDSKSKKHEQRATITAQGIRVEFLDGSVPEAPEDLFFYIAASGNVNGNENATRFSELSISGQKAAFLDIFTKEYPWISDISIEMNGGIGVLYARVEKPIPASRPLAFVSGGINRVLSILLCIASASGGVVLVDEIDNGIHHSHHAAVWRMLLALCDKFNAQLIMTTHSNEWLRALVEAGPGREEEVSLWRVTREESGASVKQFGGRQAFVAIESGVEIR